MLGIGVRGKGLRLKAARFILKSAWNSAGRFADERECVIIKPNMHKMHVVRVVGNVLQSRQDLCCNAKCCLPAMSTAAQCARFAKISIQVKKNIFHPQTGAAPATPELPIIAISGGNALRFAFLLWGARAYTGETRE
jgi:hypothetical protein